MGLGSSWVLRAAPGASLKGARERPSCWCPVSSAFAEVCQVKQRHVWHRPRWSPRASCGSQGPGSELLTGPRGWPLGVPPSGRVTA